MRISSYPWVGHCLPPPPTPSWAVNPAQIGLRKPPDLNWCNSLCFWFPDSNGQPCWVPEYNLNRRQGPHHCSLFKTHHTKPACQSRVQSCSEVPMPLHRLFSLMKMTEMAFFCLHTNSHAFDSKANSVRLSLSNLTLIWQKVTLPPPEPLWPLGCPTRKNTLCGLQLSPNLTVQFLSCVGPGHVKGD